MSGGDPGLDRLVALARADPARLVCIVGPTASGKTDLAIALAERVDGEIVSADSVQIYRGFDIGSGKATAEERTRAPHHLVDTHDPLEAVDAASYARLAEEAIGDIRARGKTAIVCGGTFFWIRALVHGLAPAPPADDSLRARHRAIVAESGREALHAALGQVDPPSAARLHPNDVVRVSRALEVFELSGKPMSTWQREHGFRGRRHEALLVGRDVSGEELAARIGARVEGWLRGGFVEEVESLLARGYREARPMSSVGYAEVRDHVDGKLSGGELRDAIVQSTRVFVRRQRTWLRGTDVTWL